MIENGDTVHSVADLAGKKIYSTGQGATPEYGLRYILAGNGLDPDKDVEIEFKSEAAEVASAMLSEEGAVAVLPKWGYRGVSGRYSWALISRDAPSGVMMV